MKIRMVSFSNYTSEIKVYDYHKMDLFVLLLIKVLEKDNDKTIKECLLELDVTNSLLYLYQNNFYSLLDNGFIINDTKNEDIASIRTRDIRFSDFGKLCIKNKSIPVFKESVERKIIYDPLKEQLFSENKKDNDSNLVVVEGHKTFFEIINENRKSILSRYDDNFMLNYEKYEADPYYFSVDIRDDFGNNLKLKEILRKNASEIIDYKTIDTSKCEFMSAQLRLSIFYGEESKMVSSEYYLLVNEAKKFMVEGNKVYIENIEEELTKYSFVEINNKMWGYMVGVVEIMKEKYPSFEKEKLKDYTSNIKMYLLRNKDKFSNSKIVEEIISRL